MESIDRSISFFCVDVSEEVDASNNGQRGQRIELLLGESMLCGVAVTVQPMVASSARAPWTAAIPARKIAIEIASSVKTIVPPLHEHRVLEPGAVAPGSDGVDGRERRVLMGERAHSVMESAESERGCLFKT